MNLDVSADDEVIWEEFAGFVDCTAPADPFYFVHAQDMPKSDPSHSIANAGRSRRAKPNGSAVQRVDAPHTLAADPPEPYASEHTPPTMAIVDEAPAAEQLRLHAEQISVHLGSRQKELDHREAELNSRAAKLESDTRAARLWLSEHESELASRSREIAKQQEMLLKQQQTVEKSRRSTPAGSPQGRQPSSSSADLVLDEDHLRRKAELLEARERHIDEAESRVGIAHTDIERIQEDLLTERRTFQDEVVATRRQIAAEQRASMADLEQKRQAVQRRSEHVDQCRIALTQLHGELERVQRETLEVRLATEELWAQLSGEAPPATVTRSLGRIRARLAEHYRQADAELVERQKQLEGLRAELSEKCEHLVDQKRHFEQWLACLQEQAEEQASRLVAREQQIRREETRLQEESSGWRSERLKYQQEIRRLRAERATREDTAVPQ